MHAVAVRILHQEPGPEAGPLTRSLASARLANAERLERRFRSTGARDVRIEAGEPDRRTFGERLRIIVEAVGRRAGLVVLGSGSIPLAGRGVAAALVAVAGSGERRALTNSFYSADVVAVGHAANLARVPDLPSDNALPRWLHEEAGYRVEDLRRRWRLAIDLDSPLDVLLAGGGLANDAGAAVSERIARLREIAADRRAELVVAGRTGSGTLRWLEAHTASRTRALVEERGLRAIGLGTAGTDKAAVGLRPPRSVLGLVLDDRGPEALGDVLRELGDAAIVDTRVLLAHRLGPDEARWPDAEDRFASDLLLPDRIGDRWLRALTTSASEATLPILLGGHTLVGPGVRLVLAGR